MRLLFDQNLSPKLVGRLADVFPGSSHVLFEGLDSASDEKVWEFCRLNEFAIVTKDADYNNLSVMLGVPPKVIWLLLGNCTTTQIESVIRRHSAEIEEFERDSVLGTLALR